MLRCIAYNFTYPNNERIYNFWNIGSYVKLYAIQRSKQQGKTPEKGRIWKYIILNLVFVSPCIIVQFK